MQHNVTNDHCMQSLLVILPEQTRCNVYASVSRTSYTAVLLEMRLTYIHKYAREFS